MKTKAKMVWDPLTCRRSKVQKAPKGFTTAKPKACALAGLTGRKRRRRRR